MVQRLIALPALKRVAHHIAMKEDGRRAESRLRQLKHHADLENEVHAFATEIAFFFGGHAIEDRGCQQKLFFGE